MVGDIVLVHAQTFSSILSWVFGCWLYQMKPSFFLISPCTEYKISKNTGNITQQKYSFVEFYHRTFDGFSHLTHQEIPFLKKTQIQAHVGHSSLPGIRLVKRTNYMIWVEKMDRWRNNVDPWCRFTKWIGSWPVSISSKALVGPDTRICLSNGASWAVCCISYS